MIDSSRFDPEALKLFLEEAGDMEDQIEESLLLLENDPSNQEAVNTAFRGFHTIKGGAGMIGFEELQQYTHQVESLLSDVRGGEKSTSPELISALLGSIDCLRSFCKDLEGIESYDQQGVAASLEEIQKLSGTSADIGEPQTEADPEPTVQSEVSESNESGFSRFLIELRFPEELLQEGGDPLLLLKDLHELGECIVTAHVHSIPQLEILDPSKLYLHWSVLLNTEKSEEDLENVLMFFLEEEGVTIRRIQGPPKETKAKQKINQGEDLPVQEDAPETKDLPPKENKETVELQTQKIEKPAQARPQVQKKEDSGGSIHVSNFKLDKLMNLVGETVINQARLKELGQEFRTLNRKLGDRYQQIIDDSDIVVRELQDQVMNIRMVPIKGAFLPLQRIVRDYSVKSGKKIKLEISGGETELDKTVSEKLGGPLKHLIRNAMDHGIELQEERVKNGKTPEGKIELKAFHSEGHVFIEVQDDGAGIDAEKIKDIARSKQLLDDETELSEEEAFQLLFLPGFSTSESISDISGRGVGMDAVRQDIESLRGAIFIKSELGKGSTFQIKLPLTLAIIEGMLVQVENQIFTIPLLSVLETLKPLGHQHKTLQKQGEVIELRGEYLPKLNLSRIFNLQKVDPPNLDPLVVVVEQAGERYGLLVDKILDQQQVVIKSMEENFFQIPGIAGATILGDGGVSLILDLPGLLKIALQNRQEPLEVS
ncbi:MAG: chemotaxis protein CheA [Proteobacteria bacterium]|nr:chemotaxis protein CheA [Pseudomonadota bacterium]